MTKQLAWLLLGLLWPLTWVSASPDLINELIDSEKQQEQKWLETPHDVPAVFLWGDQAGAEIDNPRAIDNPSALCPEVDYDQWLSQAGAPDLQGDVALNLSSQRLRELIASNCLIRPADHVVAIGESWQKEVAMDGFVFRRTPNPCPDQFQFSLWGVLKEPLPNAPLFFTTNYDVGEGDNGYTKITWKKVKSKNQDYRGLSLVVNTIDEYLISSSDRGAPNVDALYFLERRTVTTDDDRLPHNILAWCKDAHCQTLWVERVDQKRGSGHIKAVGALDFNGDGNLDLMLDGDKGGCPYRKIFQGQETGFSPMETPVLACGC